MISYNTQILQDVCFNSATAFKHLGEVAANSLQDRLSDLQAAQHVFELPLVAINVDGNFCEVKIPNVLSIQMVPNYPSLSPDVVYDWKTVERVKLMGINDVK